MTTQQITQVRRIALFTAGWLALSAPSTLALNSAASGYWTNTATWGGSVPGSGADVVILNTHTVTVDASSAPLTSLTVNSGGTLVFSGWNTVITSTTVNVNGSITHNQNSATNSPWAPDHRIYIVCSNLTAAAGGTINASGKGYNGARTNLRGYGPGGSTGNSGGSYGGLGGALNGGFSDTATYGSYTSPTDPGSAGSGVAGDEGGDGGGVIRIDATGDIVVNGTNIVANGTSRGGGGGSGGSVFITCRTITGASGSRISAGGANCEWGNGRYSRGGGGGGRIAVIYNTVAQDAIGVPPIIFDTGPGLNFADTGTLYFPNNRLLSETFLHSGQWMVPNFTNWAPNTLTITNGWLRVPSSGFRLTVTNGISLYGTNSQFHRLQFHDASVTCGGDVLLKGGNLYLLSSGGTTASMFQCGGNLVLTNSAFYAVPVPNMVPFHNADLYVFAGQTNASTSNYGARVMVSANVTLTTNCWIYPYSAATNSWFYPSAACTNGGSVYLEFGRLTLPTPTCGINADGKGYRGAPTGVKGYGPGGGASANAGAGYGGVGGNAGGGVTYGSSNAPVDPGSCGGGQAGDVGRAGGGLVWITVAGNVTLNGTITANGGTDGTTGGGSGGGIYLRCKRFTGTGSVSANGSNAGPNSTVVGGGGGGRIAIWRVYDAFLGTTNVLAGTSKGGASAPADGTIFLGQLRDAGTLFVVR